MKRGGPLGIDWQQSIEDLLEWYRCEKDIHRRTRLHALWLLRQGKTLKDVSGLVGVSYPTLQRWVAWYRQGGLAEVLQRTPGYAASGGSRYLTPLQEQAVKAKVNTGAFRTAQETARWIEARWGFTANIGVSMACSAGWR